MAKKTEEVLIKNTETIKEVEVIKEVIKEIVVEKIIKDTPKSIDLYEKLQSDSHLKSFINEFFKHYLNLGWVELNALLMTDNCLKFLGYEFDELLQTYLWCYSNTLKQCSKHNKFDKIKFLTNSLRSLYPFNEFIKQNHTLLFETDTKKYFAGNNYKLYSIQKEIA